MRVAAFFLVIALGGTLVHAQAHTGLSNRAVNAGFEEPAAPEGTAPAAWMLFTSHTQHIGITHAAKRSGEQSVRMTTQNVSGAYQGLSLKLPVVAGEKYSFFIFALNDPANPLGGTAHGQLDMEWINEQGAEIGRVYSEKWDATLSRTRWERISLRSQKAPKGAVEATFGIHLSEGARGGTGSLLADDVMITP